MKQLSCEICGSTELRKENGVFVCQSCGCQYDTEEIKKMMVEGTVEVAGTVKVDKTSEKNHFLELAESMYKSGSWKKAEEYADRVLSVSTDNARAWFIKGCAVDSLSTISEDGFPEMIACYRKVVEKLEDDFNSNGKLSNNDDLNLASEVILRSQQAMENRIIAWSKIFGDAPGDKDARDRLVNALPEYLKGFRAALAYLENVCRKNKHAIHDAWIETGATEEQANTFLMRSCTAYDWGPGMYKTAVIQGVMLGILPAIKKMSDLVVNADGYVGKYATASVCGESKQNIIDVADALEKLCDEPCLAFYIVNDDEGDMPLDELKKHLLTAKTQCLTSYSAIVQTKNAAAEYVGQAKDIVSPLMVSMETIGVSAQMLLVNFDDRKVEKAKELMEESTDEARNRAETEAKQLAFDEFDSSHQQESYEIAEAETKRKQIDARIEELQQQYASLGLFASKKRKGIVAEINNLVSEAKAIIGRSSNYESERETFADNKGKLARGEISGSSLQLNPKDCLIGYDVKLRYDGEKDEEEFTNAIWKTLQLPRERLLDNIEDGYFTLAKDVDYNFFLDVGKLLKDTDCQLEVVFAGEESLGDTGVLLQSIDGVGGGSEDSPEAKRKFREKAVVCAIARYVPIDTEHYKANLDLPLLIDGLSEKAAYALAADLATRGAEVVVQRTAAPNEH